MGRILVSAALLFVALVLCAAGFFVLYGRAETWALFFGDPDLGFFDRAAPVRSAGRNDALMCTPGLCDGVRVDAALPEYDMPPEILIARVDAAMLTLGLSLRRVDDGAAPAKARYVTYTPLFRFPDTTSFEAVSLDDGRTGLVAYARSQIGGNDFGVNRARLKTVTAKLGG
ncbi:MAG: DUF1499 domain-containing protein [Oricola sp.]